MTIKPTDWVLYTIDHKTYFSGFKEIPKKTQNRLENLHFNWNKSYLLLANNIVGLRLHLIIPELLVKYAEKAHMLAKGLNSSMYSIFDLPDGDHWLDGEMPKYEPVEGLNGILGYEAKKIVGYDYFRKLCDHIVFPEPKIFKETKHKAYWKSHDEEIKQLLKRLRNQSNMLEERPMKAKKYLVELTKYDKEKRRPLPIKEGIVVEYKDSIHVDAKDIINLVNSIYINIEDEWDKTHEVLTIEDESYTIGSGHLDYSEDRVKQFKNGLLSKLSMVNPNHYKFYFKEKPHGKFLGTGEEYIRIPKSVKIKKVLEYYQSKFPNKNYTLDKNSTKKELSERSEKLANLPPKGETQMKDLRKVCYKKKDGDMVWRGPFEEVKKLVDSGDYKFAPKAAWKKQITKVKIEGGAEILIKKGEANKSNINLPPDKGRKLGQRKEKREKRQSDKQLATLRKLQRMRNRNGQRKPGDAERKLQSETDKAKYIKKRKEKDRKIISHRVYRAFEAVILGDKAEVLATLHIKAKSNDHAERILKIIMKNKSKDGKLTGNIREWIKQTGNSKLRKPSIKTAGTKKPKNRVSSK